MINLITRLSLVFGVFLVGTTGAWAFTLSNGTNSAQVNNLGEEYRLNSPIITYAFDESFLSFFGSEGVKAVEEAVGVFNALPPVSQISTNYPPKSAKEWNLWNFPSRPDRYHPRAATLKLLDLKSATLAHLWKFMGLGSPEDNAFQFQNGDVVLRNYDPISHEPSKYVNGSLLSWVLVGGANAVSFPVDIRKPVHTLSARSHGFDTFYNFGEFFVAPTRDDIGGLRYLYNSNNFNVETLPANTFQMVTNQPDLTNPAVYSIDLRWFSKESVTNTTANFRNFVRTNAWWGSVYTNLSIPELFITETNISWELGWSTNVTPYLTNFPWTPVGQPATLVYLTNKYRVFKPSYDYRFGNVITNVQVAIEDSEVLYRSWEVVPKAPLWSVVGSVPTSTNYTKTILNDDYPQGEILILPITNNVIGYHLGDLAFERVNILTNTVTPTNNLANPAGALPGQGGGLGAGGAAITNFVGVMEDEVWASTNHAYLAYPIVLQTNSMLLGGMEKIRFERTEYESLVTTNFTKVNVNHQFPTLENRTYTFLNLGTNSFPTYTYSVDYVTNKVRQTATFVKVARRPDIIFSAGELPSTTYGIYGTPTEVNNNPIHGAGQTGLFGPGNLRFADSASVNFTYNKLGVHWQMDPFYFLNEENQLGFGWNWGKYDGSIAEPIVFPDSKSIKEFEKEVYSGSD